MDKNSIKTSFPGLHEIELIEEIAEFGIERDFKAGENVIRKGQYINYMPLIFSGSLKVMREDDKGNEVLLYYLQGGNTCAMSITCCTRQEKSNIWAIAEEDSKLLLIPIDKVDAWMKKYSTWRDFILSSYSVRMEELLVALESIAFKSLDERLLKYLNDRSKAIHKKEFTITHSEIAKELHSSREAISRLLKKLENLGKVELGRNKIRLLENATA